VQVAESIVEVTQVPSLQRPVAFCGGVSLTIAADGAGSARTLAGRGGATRVGMLRTSGAGSAAAGRTDSTGALALGSWRGSESADGGACTAGAGRERGATDDGGAFGDFGLISAGALSRGARAEAGAGGLAGPCARATFDARSAATITWQSERAGIMDFIMGSLWLRD
jgi:hypothetical protein